MIARRAMTKTAAADLRCAILAEIARRDLTRRQLAAELALSMPAISNALTPTGAIQQRGRLVRIARHLGLAP